MLLNLRLTPLVLMCLAMIADPGDDELLEADLTGIVDIRNTRSFETCNGTVALLKESRSDRRICGRVQHSKACIHQCLAALPGTSISYPSELFVVDLRTRSKGCIHWRVAALPDTSSSFIRYGAR